MKQSLQLKISQQLAMTPQLQQAIRLLQLSSIELQTEIQEALDSNLMLETTDDNNDLSLDSSETSSEQKSEHLSEQSTSNDSNSDNDLDNSSSSSEDTTSSDIPDDLPMDADWNDVYDGSTSYSAPSSDYNDLFENQSGSGESLSDHLLWQLEMTNLSDIDTIICENIIDSIDEYGYLKADLDTILESVNTQHPQFEVELDEVEAALKQVQNFDPIGVGARDLQECLLIQLNSIPDTTPWQIEAKFLVENYLNLLGNRQYSNVMRKMKLDEEELQMLITFIQTLNPRPGSQISNGTTPYVVPDVFIVKRKGIWTVDLNPDTAPKLRINPNYAGLIKRGDSSDDNTCLKNHLQEARWFIKSLKSRNETLLKVANCIVNKQYDFFDHGEEAMKPLILREVAEEVEMHESTISRITTQKYMHTPRGIFEFKYFFSSHVSSESGDEVSATAIRARIKKLIESEDTKKPLSDSKLSTILNDEGIEVARRTVAKYRESMNIPSSNERRRLS